MRYRDLDKTKIMRRKDWSCNKPSVILKEGVFLDLGTTDSKIGLDFNDAIADDWINLEDE